MSTDAMFERRLATVEEAIADLQRKLVTPAPPVDWLDRVIGSVTDKEAFAEVLAHGRAMRDADRPQDDIGTGP